MMTTSFTNGAKIASFVLYCLAVSALVVLLRGTAHAQSNNTAVVLVFEYSYSPKSVTVPAGSAITWRNVGKVAHTATAAGVFDTGSIAPGAEVTVTLTKPGTYRYVDQVYGGPTGEGMNGTVVVTEAPARNQGAQTPGLPPVGADDQLPLALLFAAGTLTIIGLSLRAGYMKRPRG